MLTLSGRGAAAAVWALVAAFGLSACEYADAEPLPGEIPTALQSVPDSRPDGPSAQEQARQTELIAEVEAQLGPESDRRVASMLGAMGNTGLSVMGLVPDHGSYLIRAACSPGPAAKLTVSQGSVQLLDHEVPCGVPFQSTVQLTAGRVTATMSPTSRRGPPAAAVRLETAPTEPTAVPSPAAPPSSSP